MMFFFGELPSLVHFSIKNPFQLSIFLIPPFSPSYEKKSIMTLEEG
jgi:hypothetical protein